jgi:drug/metabolite transporter (DMT)-like permease
MIQQRIFLGLTIGLISYSTLYLGKGIQKFAVEGIKSAKTLKTKHSGIWIVGTVLTTLPAFLQWAALLLAPVNLIAPMEGIGLIILLFYASRKLHEKISIIEAAAVGLVILGIFLTAFFSRGDFATGADRTGSISLPRVLYFLLPLTAVETILVLVALKLRLRTSGYILGFTAGTVMAFQTLSKRISGFPGFAVHGIIGVVIFASLTIFVTQLGFTRAEASQVVPAFTAASIITATAAGVLILSEKIAPAQIAGTALVAAAVVVMTAGGILRKAPAQAAKQVTAAGVEEQ